jgi:hypothetical protein
MYDGNAPRRATGRDRSSAEVERNAQPSSLSRSDLSWRALLFAMPVLPPPIPFDPPSALLEGQGIAVFRRDEGRTYVALDYGHSGGGHGHPDRLNLLFSIGDTRWLDDFGTGSYTDPSLHWYRSTLAHNAPLIDGKSQQRVHGELVAYDERDEIGWIEAAAREIAPGVNVTRSIVVTGDYAIDSVRWNADRDVTFDLPIHAALQFPVDRDGMPRVLAGGDGLEDGFEFAHGASVVAVPANMPLHGVAVAVSNRIDAFICASQPAQLWRAVAPGAPGSGEHAFRLVRVTGAAGEMRSLWSWHDQVANVEWHHDLIRVHATSGAIDEHRRDADRWSVVRIDGESRTEIDLAGRAARSPYPISPRVEAREPLVVPRDGALTIQLGEAHYRRSEQSWTDAQKPTADVKIAWEGSSLTVDISVRGSERTFAPHDAANPYDNEPPDVNGDGVQLYLNVDERQYGWMLVPDAGSGAVRLRAIDGWNASQPITATWEPDDDGYRMHVVLPAHVVPAAIDVVINEKPNGRDRRRGQLVLSGGAGEFVYLRGDRHDTARLIPIRIE